MAQYPYYSDEEVEEMAKKVADSIASTESSLKGYMFDQPQWRMGPLTMFNVSSSSQNTKGSYPVSIELLTDKQKILVAEIVGKGMVKANTRSK